MNDSLKMFLIALATAIGVQLVLPPLLHQVRPTLGGTAPATVVSALEQKAPGTAPPIVALTAPSLEGMTVEAARAHFRDKGIAIVEQAERLDPGVPPRTIVDQLPEPGAPLSTLEVRVTVAKAAESMRVPDVLGKSVIEARKAMVEAGFEVAEPEKAASAEPPGTVVKQDPNPGAQSKTGQIVRLTVSEPAAIEVPKVTGRQLAAAERELDKIGLHVGAVHRVEHEEYGQNLVLKQVPAPGERVAPGAAVDLTVVAPD